MAWVNKVDMLRLLDDLEKLTLMAYDGAIRRRSDIEAQYKMLKQYIQNSPFWVEKKTLESVQTTNSSIA